MLIYILFIFNYIYINIYKHDNICICLSDVCYANHIYIYSITYNVEFKINLFAAIVIDNKTHFPIGSITYL